MRLAIGLGNPDAAHAHTRHNAGVDLIQLLLQREGLDAPAPLKDLPLAVAGTAAGVRYGIPSCYMNESGIAVGPGCRYLQIEPRNLLVIHDEVDLPPGTARFKFGGGHAGHNGLRDINRELGTGQYWRLRLGVGKPAEPRQEMSSYVLERAPAAEAELMRQAYERVLDIWDLVKAGDMSEAMRALHRKQP